MTNLNSNVVRGAHERVRVALTKINAGRLEMDEARLELLAVLGEARQRFPSRQDFSRIG